jgi:hypothetical protein
VDTIEMCLKRNVVYRCGLLSCRPRTSCRSLWIC